MTVTETLIRRVFELSEEKRYKVLIFIYNLRVHSATNANPLPDPYGTCADIRTNLSFEEFQQNRQALWGHSTEEIR
jgi:hypothetical protein